MTDELFFDTDCLSSFLWINDTNLLELLYGGNIVILAPVYQELSNPSIPHIKQRVDTLISNKSAIVQQIEADKEEYRLYRELINGSKNEKAIGNGEAAGIALAKTYNGILASNNWKDIAPFIEKFNLKHIDTGQILLSGLEKGYITESQGNAIWQKMLKRKRKLPEANFSDYICKYKSNNITI